MPVLNSDIARDLEKLADLIGLDGGNPFRIRADRNAARIVAELPRTIAATMAAAGEHLSQLLRIGRDLAGKKEILASTEHIAVLDEIERRMPAGLQGRVVLRDGTQIDLQARKRASRRLPVCYWKRRSVWSL